MDEHEVSNADYLAFVEATGASAPPQCGWKTPHIDMEIQPNEIDEVSGWFGGKPFQSE